MRLWALLVATLASSFISGCTTQQAYGAAQAWQRNECDRIMDAQDRDRCIARTRTSYDDYKRQSDAGKNSP